MIFQHVFYLFRRLKNILFLPLLILFYCSPYQKYYRYSFSETEANKLKIITVAPLNLFIGMPKELYNRTDKLYGQILDYFKQNGYEVKDNSDLKAKWDEKTAKTEGFYNPLTGKMDQNKYYKCLIDFIIEYCRSDQLDGLVIPEIAVRNAVVAGDYSYWDGVARKLEIGNEYAPSDRYDFSGSTYALSLKIDIFNNHAEQLFQSFGGIENHLRLSFKDNSKIETKENLLINENFNTEAIKIAFYPFIKNDIYPKKPIFMDK